MRAKGKVMTDEPMINNTSSLIVVSEQDSLSREAKSQKKCGTEWLSQKSN